MSSYGGGRGGYRGGRRGFHHRGGSRKNDTDEHSDQQYRDRGQGFRRSYGTEEGGGHGGQGSGGHRRGKGRRGHGRGGQGRGGGFGPPPELKGRDIGMWYAQRSKAKKQETDLQERQTVSIDNQRQRNIRRLLHDIHTSESVLPQPSKSYTDPSNSQSEITSDRTISCQKTFKDSAMEWNQSAFSSHFEDVGTESKDNQSASTSVPESWWENKEGDDSLAEETDLRNMTIPEDAAKNTEEGNIDSDEEISTVYRFTNDEDFLVIDSSDDPEIKESPITRDPSMDRQVKEELRQKRGSAAYKKMLEFRKKLPSYSMKEEILRVVNNSQVVVISGETGCGKTTQVAQFILDDCIERGQGSMSHVVCTQPRRISAVSVAERVADERAEKCGHGNSVGYQIRLESKMPRKNGSILYCTTGIVLKWLEGDPQLQRVSHIVLDEIHERDLLSDFLIIILKDILLKRPDLKLILMSATLNAEMFSQYFGDCPVLNIPGFTYNVEEFYLEDILEITGHQPSPYHHRPDKRHFWRGKKDERVQEEKEEKAAMEEWFYTLNGKYSHSTLQALMNTDSSKIDLDLVVNLVDFICKKKGEGAILIFVPGWSEISKLNEQLTRNPYYCPDRFRIIPLHSLMPTTNQKQVFERPPIGVRKIVIATNIAETSITIDDIVYVIDCGKIKLKNFVAENNLTTLEPQWVSVANARQRRGRAGRVQPGECYHLYTSLKQGQLEDYLKPEMLRTRLEEICLQIKLLKLGAIEPFISRALEPPPMESLHVSVVNLMQLNALDHNENLTPLGHHLARMPVDPHVGKMILFGAMFCCLDPILIVAASLGFKEAFTIPLGKEKLADRRRQELSRGSKSDHILLVNAFQGWERAVSRGTDGQYCWDNFLSSNTLKMLRDMKRQFGGVLKDLGFVSNSNPKDPSNNINSANQGLVKAVLCAGLYPNVAKLNKTPNPSSKGFRPCLFCTKTDKRVTLHPKSVNANEKVFESKWFVYHQKLKTNSINLHDCSMVHPYPLLFFGGDIDIRKDHDQDCVAVDDWIIFRATPSIAQLVIDLRLQLNRVLEEKIVRPGPTQWNVKEGAVMRAIIDLISAEDARGW